VKINLDDCPSLQYYINAMNSFDFFHNLVLDNDGSVFDSELSLIATDDNMLSIALWLAYFNKNYCIAVDGMLSPGFEVMYDLLQKINHMLLPDDIEGPDIRLNNKRLVHFENGSRIHFTNRKEIMPATKGLSINTVISNRKLSDQETFMTCVMPVLYSGRNNNVKFIEPYPNIDKLLIGMRSAGVQDATLGFELVSGYDVSPTMNLTMSMYSVEIYNDRVDGTLEHDFNVDNIYDKLSKNVAFKLLKLGL